MKTYKYIIMEDNLSNTEFQINYFSLNIIILELIYL